MLRLFRLKVIAFYVNSKTSQILCMDKAGFYTYIRMCVIVRVAVVFRINCASNAGWKFVKRQIQSSTNTVSCMRHESN